MTESMLVLPAGNVAEPLVAEPPVAEPLVAEPLVDIDDVAKVVAAAFADPRHAHQEHDVTGPRLLSIHDAIAKLRRTTGWCMAHQPISLEPFHVARSEPDGPLLAEVSIVVCSQICDDRNARPETGVQRARKPRNAASNSRHPP